MSNAIIFTISPVILVRLPVEHTKHSSSSHSPTLFTRKIKYKYPSLKKIDFNIDQSSFPLKLPLQNGKLHNSFLSIPEDHKHCRYQRVLPSFKSSSREHSVIHKPSHSLCDSSSLIKKSTPGERGHNFLFDLHSKRENPTRLVRVKSIPSHIDSYHSNAKRLISLTRNILTNKGSSQSFSTKLSNKPKFSCVYARKEPALDFSLLFQSRRVHIPRISIK